MCIRRAQWRTYDIISPSSDRCAVRTLSTFSDRCTHFFIYQHSVTGAHIVSISQHSVTSAHIIYQHSVTGSRIIYQQSVTGEHIIYNIQWQVHNFLYIPTFSDRCTHFCYIPTFSDKCTHYIPTFSDRFTHYIPTFSDR